jgi:hypothetical protein
MYVVMRLIGRLNIDILSVVGSRSRVFLQADIADGDRPLSVRYFGRQPLKTFLIYLYCAGLNNSDWKYCQEGQFTAKCSSY